MKRAFLQFGFRLRRWVYRRFRIRTRGVKVMVFNPAGELLLVRHSYGNRRVFLIPGGGVKPFEKPESAAPREIREEVGLRLERLAFKACYYSNSEGKRDIVSLFTAVSDEAPKADAWEIEEAGFFALDSLPENVSPSTLRRIGEYRENRLNGGVW
jgi:ADP-ribose pyrophosphatase YjhB (NUDIX family)